MKLQLAASYTDSSPHPNCDRHGLVTFFIYPNNKRSNNTVLERKIDYNFTSELVAIGEILNFYLMDISCINSWHIWWLLLSSLIVNLPVKLLKYARQNLLITLILIWAKSWKEWNHALSDGFQPKLTSRRMRKADSISKDVKSIAPLSLSLTLLDASSVENKRIKLFWY